MRLRRMLAFVLTLALLMGNVMPAYAADTQIANTITGDVTLTTDENGNIVITDNSNETSELSDLGEETPAPDAGEETPTPDAGEETPAPDAGEETPAPDAGEETLTPDAGEETPIPEEEEILEEELEDIVEEEEVIVLGEDEELPEGNITITYKEGNSEVKYTTVKEAIEAAEELAEPGGEVVTVNLPMEGGSTFTVTGSDLVVADSYNVALGLNGNTLILDATEGTTVESNVNILNGTVNFGAPNMTFQILEKVSAPSIYNVTFGGELGTATLKIGGNSADNSEALASACINFYQVSTSGMNRVEIYDGLNSSSAIEATTLYVDLDWIELKDEEELSYYTRESITLGNVSVDNFELINGHVSWSDVLVEKSTRITSGSSLELHGSTELHNLVISDSHDVIADKTVKIERNFYGTTGESGVVTYVSDSDLTLAESVTVAEGKAINLECTAYIDDQESILLPYGKVVANIAGESKEGCISADLFKVAGANLVREGNQLILKEQQEKFLVTYWSKNKWKELGKYNDFATLYDALDDNKDRIYNVQLLKDVELSDEHWNFADLIVNLQLYEDYENVYNVSVAKNAKASITVDCINAFFIDGAVIDNYGSGRITIGDGAVLNLRGDKYHLEKDLRSLSINNLDITAGNNSKLVCNSTTTDVREMLAMGSCYFHDTQNLDVELYGNINWNAYMRSDNARDELVGETPYDTPENMAADIRSLKVVNAKSDGAFIGNVITVDNLDVAGNLNCDAITADKTTLKTGSFVCTTDEMTLKNITVTQGENTNSNCVTLATEDIYKEGKPYHTGEIYLQDSLNCMKNTCIDFDKSAVNVVMIQANWGSYPDTVRYEEGAQIANNEVLASLSATNGEPGQLFSNSSYALYRDGFKSFVEQDENSNYTVKAIDTTNGIFVMDNTTGNRQSCKDLAEVKEFIFANVEEGSRFEIILNTVTSAKNLEDLDYSGLNIDSAEIKLNLNGCELKLMDNQVVAVDMIDGFKRNSETEIKGKLTLAAKNTIKPRKWDANIWGTNLKSNNTELTLGNAGDVPNSNVNINEAGTGISFKKVTTYGNVSWNGATDENGKPTDDITVTEKVVIDNINDGENLFQSAYFRCKLTTKDLDMVMGDLGAADLTVSNKLTAQTGHMIMVDPLGKVSLKDIHVTSESKETDGNNLRIELHRRVELAEGDDRDNPNFAGAKELDGVGTVSISGKVTADDNVYLPVRFQKNNDYLWETDGDGNDIWTGRTGNFEKDETIATVKTESASKFGIATEPWDDNACTKKVGTALQAATSVLWVRHVAGYEVNEWGDMEPVCDKEAKYVSLEDAIKGIVSDFDSTVGEYIFHFISDEKLSKDLTIPDCVTVLQLRTEGGGFQEGDDFHYTGEILRELDLNGYTLNTKATVDLSGGLRIVSNSEKAGTLKLNGTQGDALNIYENSNLVYENGNNVEVRPAVFKNVKVNAPNGTVRLHAGDREQMQDMEATTITAKRVESNRGNWQCSEVNATEFGLRETIWNCKKVTATNLQVGDYGEPREEKSELTAEEIIINDTGRMEVFGVVGSYGWGKESKRPNLTLNGGKLWIQGEENDPDGKGQCYLNTLTVSKVFGAESIGEYTVENNGQFFINTLEMKAGTLYNRGNMIVKTINNIKDFHNEDSLICNTFNQIKGSKTYLGGGSRLLINQSGTLYNVNLGSVRGGGDDPVLGLGGKEVTVQKENETITELRIADVAIKGNFTQNYEFQTLQIAVTDSYLNIDELNGSKTYFNPYTYMDVGEEPGEENGEEPGEENGEEPAEDGKVHLFTLDKGKTLFTTDQEDFPAESVKVHPFYELDENGKEAVENENGDWIDNINSSTIHYKKDNINEVRVAGKTIALFYQIEAEERIEWLKGFTDWQDAMSYLSLVGNRNTTYELHVDDEVLDVGGSLKLPSNVASIEIVGIRENATEVINMGDGKITLSTNVVLANLKLPANTAISTNGKDLKLRVMAGKIQSITGKKADDVTISNSSLEITKGMSKIRSLYLYNSDLDVTGDLTVTELIMENDGREVSLTSTGKFTITDIVTIGEGNSLYYGKGLEIKGDLTSNDSGNVFAEPIKEITEDPEGNEVIQITGYEIKDDFEDIQDEVNYRFVKKNAINLGYTGGKVTNNTVLATAPKIASSWFVYDRSINEQDEVQITNVTRKEESSILCGTRSKENDKVILEANGLEIDSYATLQEAFDEIDRIGNSQQNYIVTLTDNVSVNGNYTFPSKASYIRVVSEANNEGTQYSISFKNKADIKCNVDFDNVVLKAAEAKSTLAINGCDVKIKKSQLSENIAIKGSGTTNGSRLVISGDNDGSYVRVASINDVDIFSVGSTIVYIDGSTTVGDLYIYREGKLCGRGAIKTDYVECGGTGTIVTFPTLKTNGEAITEFKSTLEITGNLNVIDLGNEENLEPGVLNISLGKSLDFNKNEDGTVSDDLEIYGAGDFPDSLVAGNKIVLAKAPKVFTKNAASGQIVEFVQNGGLDGGHLYKKGGNIVYKDNAPAAELSYWVNRHGESYDESAEMIEVATECETFADAVAEINNLKTKRDYRIRFLHTEESIAAALTMPKSSNVNALILTSMDEETGDPYDVYYLNGLSFSSPVVLENISFVQMQQEKDNKGNVIPGEYREITDVVDFPTPVSVKTSGSELVMAGQVYFNTPISFSGEDKAVLTVADNAVVQACTPDVAGSIGLEDENYIQGSITKFKGVTINDEFYLDTWQTDEENYGTCTMDVTALTLNRVGEVYVGPNSEDIDSETVVKVKNLTVDTSDLVILGNAQFTNVTLSGFAPSIFVSGQTFNITGLLTGTAYGANLVTTVNDEGESVLNISGTAVLGDAEQNRIMVQVLNEELSDPVKLAGIETNEAGEEVYISGPLLKAKNINSNVFLVHDSCVEGGEYSLTSGDGGYFLKKNGDYVEVHPSEGIVAALCKSDEIPENEEEEIPVINYYGTLNEAIAEIKALNKASQEYTIMLLDNVGTAAAPYVMTIPEMAAKVTFTKPANSDNVEVFINTKLTQKTDLAFENIAVTNKNVWDTKNYELAINGGSVTITGNATVVDLTLENAAVLTTENTAAITNITNINTAVGTNNEIICTKAAGLTIKGNVTNIDRNEQPIGENFPRVILDAAGKATSVEATGTDIGEEGVQYDLSKATKIAALEKEAMDRFVFQNGGEDVNTVWASKGIYLVENNYEYATGVMNINITDTEPLQYDTVSYTQCLDMAEAANYINTVSGKENAYIVCVNEEVSDTKVTDKKEISEFTLPAKDKAELVIVTPNDDGTAVIDFTGDVAVKGNVVFERLDLNNAKPFSIAMDKGEYTFEMAEVEAAKLNNIAGNSKGKSSIAIYESSLNLSGGITDVVELILMDSDITTNAASKVKDNLMIFGRAVWNAYGATTIGNVALELSAEGAGNTYLATYHNSSNPQLTITGNVTGGKLPVKIYDFATKDDITNYSGAKLVLAKAESADKFIAYDYAQYNGETGDYEYNTAGVQAYKDKSGYVSNGTIDDKKVLLGQQDENGGWTQSYVKSYAEAIEIINNSGTKTSVYKITLRGDEETVKVGSLTLPKKDKAQTLIIAGNGAKNNGDSVEERTLKYKGTIQPKCNLVFENVTLEELDSDNKTVNGITVKPDVYNVTFGDNVEVTTTNNFGEGADLVFKAIDGKNGSVTFGNGSAYVSGELKLKELAVSGNANILSKGKVTVTNIAYKNADSEEGVTLTLTGEKEITITNVSSENDDNTLDVTTYYKNKAFTDSETQLTISGEVDSGVAVVVRPWIYDKKDGTPHPMTEKDIEMLSLGADASPKKFQKVINAAKMIASEEVKVYDTGLRAIKHDGGIYFTNEESGIEVVGYQVTEEDETEMYRAEFFTWDQAVKEIDKLNKPAWKYEINVLNDQGCGTPLKTVTMPSKAKELVINGVDKWIEEEGQQGWWDQAGILTTSNKITLKCATEFNNISLCAVKKNGGYYRTPLTLDCSKYALTLNGLNRGCNYDDMGWFEGSIIITGQTAGSVEVMGYKDGYCDMISQISKVGTVVIHPGIDENQETMHCQYEISDGIKSVKNLEILPGAQVDTVKSEVSVTNLTIGEATGELEDNGEEDRPQRSNEFHSSLRAKNIAVSGTTIMASSDLKAGTTTVGDGKITLGTVIFRDTSNHIAGKQDKNGNSLIQIKGIVNFDADYPNPQHWSGTCISLFLSNSVEHYAKLAEGMTLLNAPKAPSSMFSPDYEWIDDRGTEDENDDERYQNMGPDMPGWGLYKSGNDIKYGNLEQTEVRLYIGTGDAEGENGKVPSIEYATFEEAVKAIDSLARYKQDGSKDYEEYTIELLKDVMIGNDKGNGKYSTLTLPSKTSQLTIWGRGNSLEFSGNVTLKCDTTLQDIQMVSMKAVNGQGQSNTMNVAVGKYTLTNRRGVSYGYYDQESMLNNITGSKGSLVMEVRGEEEDSYLEVNNISGISVVFKGDGEAIHYVPALDEEGNHMIDGEGNPIEYPRVTERIIVKGNLTAKELKYIDYAAGVIFVEGKFIADAICAEGENHIVLSASDKYPVQIKGMTKTIDGENKNKSVFLLEDEDGRKTEMVTLSIVSSTGQMLPAGTKAITGKNLDINDWCVWNEWQISEDYFDGGERILYFNGADLYLGDFVSVG